MRYHFHQYRRLVQVAIKPERGMPQFLQSKYQINLTSYYRGIDKRNTLLLEMLTIH
jgi:hypothetical protein